MGKRITLAGPPLRIVSLVPSQTELLSDLGLENEVVGITKFCVHPANWRKSKTVVGGTKNFHFDTIDGLHPDLIIGNKEENYFGGISELKKKYPVWMSDITTIDDAISMIQQLSILCDREDKGASIIQQIESGFDKVKPVSPLSTLYLMWRDPWMGVAGKTFIHHMMEKIGLKNVLSNCDRYPELMESELKDLNPQLVLLSTEPYPFNQKHIPEIQRILPEARILIADGEMFSWYGSRMSRVDKYFNSLEL